MSGIASGMGQFMQGMNNEEAAGGAGRAQMNWNDQGIQKAGQIYEGSKANFDPYLETGNQAEEQLQSGMGPNGRLGRAFTMADFNNDPAYKFNQQQGLAAIANSNSVRGGALSGGTLKALSNYGQQTASNEFGAAAERFRTNQNQNFGQLSSLAGQGLTAANNVASLGTNYSTLQNGQMVNQGNAQAGMILGQAAGRNQQIGGFMGAMGSAASMGMAGS